MIHGFRYILLVFALSLISLTGLSQEVILTAGNYSENSTSTLHWTIGQIVTGAETNGAMTLIQGFNQSMITVTSVYDVGIDECEINVYPNPVKDILSVLIKKNESNKPLSAHIINGYGQKVQVIQSIEFSEKIDVSQLIQGIYYLSFYYEENLFQTFKIIVL